MPSIAAKNVALDVIKAVGKGKRINLKEIQLKNGYTLESARSSKALQTKSYKETVEAYVNRLDKLRSKILTELSTRDLSEERFSALSESLDRFTKQSQVLQGKSTENIATVVNVIDYSKAEQ